MYDLIIRNALIYDGVSSHAYMGHVGICDGKIVSVGTEPLSGGRKMIDAQGLSLSPGFIDVHSHSDYCLYKDPHRQHVLQMGVTTEISGQCGNSISPVPSSMSAETRKYLASRGSPLFETMEEHLKTLSCWELGPNQLHFTGHGLLRGGAMELRADRAGEKEILKMQEALEKAVLQGSAGLSTGLSYVPGIYSDSHELIELAKAAARAGGMYVTHSRSESMGLFDSVRECIAIALEASIPVNISHFKCVGKVFWDRCQEALEMIDSAIARGADITLDAYPYTAASTTTLSAIPARFLDRGAEAFARDLENPEIVRQIRKEIYEINDPSWDNSMYYVGLDKFLIVRAEQTPWAVGKTYAQVGEELGMDPFDAVVYLLKANHGCVYECRHSMCEENVEMILKHPKCMVGSDGLYVPGDLSCHPRAFGTFPRYLGRYIRQKQLLSREEGIRRLTDMPARRYGLTGKGRIQEGYDADLVLFDYDTILDRADYMDPMKPNIGIYQVYMNGQLVLENNEPTGSWHGKYLGKTKKKM